MPRKSSPIAGVIKFFMTAAIADARAGVELAQSIVKHRESGAVSAVAPPALVKKKVRGPNKPKAAAAATAPAAASVQ